MTLPTAESQIEEHAHASDGHYIRIALVLAVLTAIETGTYFIDTYDDHSTLLLLTLLPIMVVKFFLVAWFFMHLKNDSRIFSRLFCMGIVLAVMVYVIMMLTFNEFF